MTTTQLAERRYIIALLAHLALALIWLVLTGLFTAQNFIIGLVIAAVLLWILAPSAAREGQSWAPGYVRKIGQVMRFGAFFATELLAANLRMAVVILRPRLRVRPAIIAIPLDLRTDAEITLLANMITLTPGTLSLEVSQDKRTLYVHVVDVGDDPDTVRRTIKEEYERRVMEVMR